MDVLAAHYNDGSSETQPEYLETHLLNAQTVLDMMRTGAKPLLVLMTDATCSLLGRSTSQSNTLDTVIQRLHAADTKIITVDLGDENRVGNTFGFVNHDEHLKYLAYVTCGAHFDYSALLKLAGKFTQSYLGGPLSTNKLLHNTKSVWKPGELTTGNLLRPSNSQTKLNSLAGIRATSNSHHLSSSLVLSYFKSIPAEPTDLSENDQFHAQLNSLQKLMFARPCNYSAFLQHSEI